jgi:hypothetical protein
MGIHAENLTRQQAVIADRQQRRDRIQAAISECRAEANSLSEKAESLSSAVVEGDRKAMQRKVLVFDQRREVDVRVRDLEGELSSLDRQLDQDHKTLDRLRLFAGSELLSNNVKSKLSVLAARLSELAPPVAEAAGQFRVEFDAAIDDILPFLENGDPARLRSLREQLRTVVVKGLRSQLANDFQSCGLHLLDASPHWPKTFVGVVGPAIDSLIGAIELTLPANDAEGTARFRCVTQISGMHGLLLRENETVTLRPDDLDVHKLLQRGALELVDPIAIAKGAS